MAERVTVPGLLKMKERGEKIVVVTCYDYPSARLLDSAGVDVIFIGDSLGDNVLGYPNTLPVTMDEMIHHSKAVSRGTERALVLADMPFLSCQISAEQALINAGRFVKEAGVEAVKLEGGFAIAPAVEKIVQAGIPVMGHLGLTPQSVHKFGGYRMTGRDNGEAEQMKSDARALVDAGIFSIVLELVSPDLAKEITADVPVPTIGIGSGPHCDGQVQVFHDLFGLNPDRKLRHVKRYAEAGNAIRDAAERFAAEVRSGEFPSG
jgi:3-methyl-2-oxobutanoate hydroxymethyltransferase